jgi:predicted transposase YdaD
LSEISDGQEDIPDDFKNEPSILEASEYAKESAYTKTELEAYDRYWDSISSEKTLITEAFDEGKQIGLEKGKIEGEQIGQEKEKKNGIIKALKRGKLSIEEIAEDFEVSIEYVLEIKKTMD